MRFRKTTAGNYIGYFPGHYVFIYKRPHGSYCAVIRRIGSEYILYREGYFGTCLSTLSKAKDWVTQKLKL